MDVLTYERVSNNTQNSFNTQDSKISQYCLLHNLNIIDIYREKHSGRDSNRNILKAVLLRMINENINGLVVYDVSRLSRNVENMKDLLDLAKLGNFTYYFVKDNITTNDNNYYDKILELTKYAQYESDNKSKVTKDSLEIKRLNNEKTGGILEYGYDLKDGKKVLNIGEQAVIGVIIKLKDDYNMSYNQICKVLDILGKKSKTGKSWSASTVRTLYNRYK